MFFEVVGTVTYSYAVVVEAATAEEAAELVYNDIPLDDLTADPVDVNVDIDEVNEYADE